MDNFTPQPMAPMPQQFAPPPQQFAPPPQAMGGSIGRLVQQALPMIMDYAVPEVLRRIGMGGQAPQLGQVPVINPQAMPNVFDAMEQGNGLLKTSDGYVVYKSGETLEVYQAIPPEQYPQRPVVFMRDEADRMYDDILQKVRDENKAMIQELASQIGGMIQNANTAVPTQPTTATTIQATASEPVTAAEHQRNDNESNPKTIPGPSPRTTSRGGRSGETASISDVPANETTRL